MKNIGVIGHIKSFGRSLLTFNLLHSIPNSIWYISEKCGKVSSYMPSFIQFIFPQTFLLSVDLRNALSDRRFQPITVKCQLRKSKKVIRKTVTLRM